MQKPQLTLVAKAVGDTGVLTNMGQIAFAAVIDPKENLNGEMKFSCVFLFEKGSDTHNELKRAATAAAKAKWGDKIPADLRNPIRDGSEKEYEGFAGMLYISPTAKKKPGIVDQRNKPVTSDDVIYSGCWVRVHVNAFAYDQKGNKGVSFGLENIQVLGDGDPFSGRKRADQVFQPVVDAGNPFPKGEDEDEAASLF